MSPTLNNGDVIWVDKWGFNQVYSFLSKDFSFSAFGEASLNRNDLVIVENPAASSSNIKRLVALPGDTIRIRNRKLWINDIVAPRSYPILSEYRVSFKTDSSRIVLTDMHQQAFKGKLGKGAFYLFNLTDSAYINLSKNPGVQLIRPIFESASRSSGDVWPHWKRYGWNKDIFGPVYIPKKGDSIALNRDNYLMYKELILNHEKDSIYQGKDGLYYLDTIAISQYHFKQDYIFVLGDNRAYSTDSHFYGPIPAAWVRAKAKRLIFTTFAKQNPTERKKKRFLWKKL